MIDHALLAMFAYVNGEMSGSCYLKTMVGDDQESTGIAVMKDGNECWSKSKLDILCEYIALKDGL